MSEKSKLDRIKRIKQKPERLADPNAESAAARGTCNPLNSDIRVTDVVDFHASISVGSANAANDGSKMPREIACTPILKARFGVGLDLLLQQTWVWLDQRLGSPQLTLSLAPCEERTIEVSTTRRRLRTDLRRAVTESVTNRETSDSSRSSTDVAQTSAHRRNWSFGTNGSIGISGRVDANLGADFSLQDAVDDTTTESMQSLQEETVKSSEQLRSMQEVKVETTQEDVIRRSEKRVLHNPYRDRSLTLNFFSIIDRYQVLNIARSLAPVLWMRFESLDLDEQFVLANASFLEATLLDRSLAIELSGAVATARRRRDRQIDPQVARVVADAFTILLDADHGVFRDFDVQDSEDAAAEFRISASLDAAIATADGSRGIREAALHGLGRSYTAIAAAHFLRKRNQQALSDGSISEAEHLRRELELCTALAEVIQPEWRALPNGNMDQVLDSNDNCELMRRMSGFLMIVESVLRPMLGEFRTRLNLLNIDSENEDQGSRIVVSEPEVDEGYREADHLIHLVVEHMKCHADFYRKAYLRDLFDTTSGQSFRSLLIRIIFDAAGAKDGVALVEMIDWNSAYLDDDSYSVGFRSPFTDDVPELLAGVAETLEIPIKELSHVSLGFADNLEILEVPGFGTHIEPFAGKCVLQDVPECGTASLNTELSMKCC